MKRWAVVLTMLLLAGCSRATPPPDTGVQGSVWIGPMCPVVQIGTDCPDRPYSARLVVLTPDGEEAAQGESDATGAFRIALPPGEYVLVPQTPDAGIPFASEIEFTVPAEGWATLSVQYDSGIR